VPITPASQSSVDTPTIDMPSRFFNEEDELFDPAETGMSEAEVYLNKAAAVAPQQ
jgi:hypothetical protein